MRVRTARLDEVAQISGGGTPSRTQASYFGGAIAWATPTDVTSLEKLHISATKESITEAGLRESSTKLMPPGTVLLTSRATIGFTAVSAIPIATNQGFINFVCGAELKPEFLAYWLRTQRAKIIQHAGGTTFKEIARGTLRKFEIRFPPLSEQHRIVDLLSRAEEVVSLRREAQRRAAELVPAVFLDMFGGPTSNPKSWPVVDLGEVLYACDYGTSKKASPDGDGIPVLRMGNVSYKGDLLLHDLKYVVLDERELVKQLLEPGDLLFNRTNSKELVGKTGIWDGRWPAVAASYFIRMRVDRARVIPIYIWAAMNSMDMKRRLFATARGAIGQSNINTTELKSLPINTPPLELQRQFAARVEAVHSIATKQATALDAAKANFDALLHQSLAFA